MELTPELALAQLERYLRRDVRPLLEPHLALLRRELGLSAPPPEAQAPPLEGLTAPRPRADDLRRWHLTTPEGATLQVSLPEAAQVFRLRPHSLRCATTQGRVYEKRLRGEAYTLAYEPDLKPRPDPDPRLAGLLDHLWTWDRLR